MTGIPVRAAEQDLDALCRLYVEFHALVDERWLKGCEE